jgi:hypothetical protein
MGCAQPHPAGHAGLGAVRPDDDRGPHLQGFPIGRGQPHGPVRPAAQHAVPREQPRARPHCGVGQGLVKQMPVNEAAGGGHILNATAVQKAAHARSALHNIAPAHIGLPHQHGRNVLGAAHGQPHHGPPLRQQHMRALPGRRAGRAGPGGPRAHNQNIAAYGAHAALPCPATSRMARSRPRCSPV